MYCRDDDVFISFFLIQNKTTRFAKKKSLVIKKRRISFIFFFQIWEKKAGLVSFKIRNML